MRAIGRAFTAALAALVVLCSSFAGADAQARSITYTLDIPSQDLEAALQQLALASQHRLFYKSELVTGKSSPALKGDYTTEQAIEAILVGTNLTYDITPSAVVLIRDQNEKPNESSRNTDSLLNVRGEGAGIADEGPNGLGLAKNQSAQQSDSNTGQSPDERKNPESPPKDSRNEDLQEVVVTGTRIRNVHDQFAPVTQVGRDEMELAGNTSVFDAIDNLSQNFGGGTSPDTSPALSTAGAGAASVNLRGLGNEATLVLLNGRRLAPGGALGGFVDISSIPVSAIDRVEILTDGASAIYGADAVAGVVNIIMRDDFSGAESRVGYSAATEGGAPAYTLGQTFGWTGNGAHGLLTFEYVNEEELLARDKEFSRGIFPDSQLLTPSSERYGIFASGGFDLTDTITLSGEAYYNHRESSSDQAVHFFGFFLPSSQQVEVEQYGAAAGLNWKLGRDWEADISAVLSSTNYYSAGSQDQSAFGFPIQLTVDAPYSEVASVDATIGGPLFSITDESVRAVVGIHGRSESLDLNSYYPASPEFDTIYSKSRDLHSIFGEIYAPIISENDRVSGVHRLALTAAVRYDEYDDFGSTTNPRYGVVWSPLGGLTFRGTYGTSFRAPSLWQARDFYSATGGVYIDPDSPTGTSVALALGGQREELGPETADVWTAGFDFRPEMFDRFQFRLTYFNVDYADRIDFPTLSSTADREFTDFTGTVIRDPSLQDVQDYIANATSFLDLADIGAPFPPFDPNNVDVILDNRMQNLASSLVEGFDIEMSYGISSVSADWTLSLDATLLTAYEQRASAAAPLSDLLNTFANPVDLRIRGGIQRASGATTAAVYVNFVDDYRDTASTNSNFVIDEWVTLDASLRLDLGQIFGGAARDASLTLTAQNIFDEPPPDIGDHPADLAFYDPANSDPAGRRLGIFLTKRW